MSQLVTIYGGSGFLGRYIARRMAKAGWRVRVAVRRPNEAIFVKPYGAVGQVEPVLCNIRDDASVAAAMTGADAVVNCVGLLAPFRKNTFDAVHVDGAERVARLAAQAGITNMVHVSALGASANGKSQYSKTKAAGEEAVLQHMPSATILRPSIMFGTEDKFFNRFAGMTRYSWVLPIVGADTKFQPVFVDDVAKATATTLQQGGVAGIFELGGPDVDTFRGLMHQMLKVIQKRRLVIGLPRFVGYMMGLGFDIAHTLSLGLMPRMITRDQVRSLSEDNIVTGEKPGFDALGIVPQSMGAILPSYLWPFRPSGQYAGIKNSAKNLKV
ncbi:MAG: complex I NDUFA9 subunit family protein [Planktomarina sp.]